MTFNDNVRLDTTQVKSGGGGGIAPVGVAVGGGGGLVLILLLVLSQCLGGGGSSGPWNFSGGSVNRAAADGSVSEPDFSHCKTGADANKYDDCRVIGTVNSLNDYWSSQAKNWQNVTTVIFSGGVQTACGAASSQVGPFYCPADQQVYIDVDFFKELENRFGADGGALAKEYVIAHEYGHHISNMLGVLDRAQQDPKGPESGAVRTELQADCFAGVWVAHAAETKDADGNTMFKPITQDDIKSALSAAAAVGDDTIMEKVQGRVTPENFTHGTAEQRQKWFLKGYDSGDYKQCDTFAAEDLG